MSTWKCVVILFAVGICWLPGLAQQADSLIQQTTARDTLTFSGSLGLTNNGFSIIPSFSLNSPALLAQLLWRMNKLGIEPDIRLTPDARKGSMIWWLRYYPVQGKKFGLRIGAHPSFLLQTREIIENGVPTEITQMRRFLAWELVPYYQFSQHIGIGIYYLQGNGLQKDGPQTTHFVNLNMSISNLKLSEHIRLKLIPAIYYLNLDGYSGNYFTATVNISHTKFPFALQSIVNKTFTSDLPGNRDFLWNISVHYNFSKKRVLIQ